ncbi:MAG: hypothetical protein J6S57_02710 [Alphaproteobacteria bacterium]|nr:hypothetical protein [Alphaproteobacteria bacterium]
MKLLTFLIGVFLCTNAFATNYPPTTPARVSIFSTTVDWEGVTGLSLHQYTGKIQGIDKDFVKQGLVLYYLDMFPCYGEASNVRIWLSPNGKPDHDLRLVCVYKPNTVSFAWRNASADALDARTTGMITCPVDGERYFTIDISKCEHNEDWKDR